MIIMVLSCSRDSKGQQDDLGADGDGILHRVSLVRPSTPPPREEAFETFKNGRGKELHAVFLQNKGTRMFTFMIVLRLRVNHYSYPGKETKRDCYS